MKSLMWFRTDLRMHDNPALNAAIKASETLVALYIVTPDTWKNHNYAPSKIDFILKNLQELSKSLSKMGIPLLIKEVSTFQDCPSLLKKLCQDHNLGAVFMNNEYPSDEVQRDEACEQLLMPNISVNRFHGALVVAPKTILTQSNKPFQVFTPFKKAWLKKVISDDLIRMPSIKKIKLKLSCDPDKVPDCVPGFTAIGDYTFIAGEKAALDRLDVFVGGDLYDYNMKRDFPDLNSTSSLSPYLAIGVLSPRQCIATALAELDYADIAMIGENQAISTWVSELIWREFYYHIVAQFPRISKNMPFKIDTDKIPWKSDKKLLNAWKEGMTGFPIVDAGMRQLKQTGWMHNRLRMICSMFLTKILQVDWRLGEKYFMSMLVDGDFSSNNGGWQWCASTGTDSAPYFRIFNPTTQSQKFDPEGRFIKKYCPELSGLNIYDIHEPHQGAMKTNILNYPKPIVDYKTNRIETIEWFKAIRTY